MATTPPEGDARGPLFTLAALPAGFVAGLTEPDAPTTLRAPAVVQPTVMPVSLGPAPQLASTFVLTRLPVPYLRIPPESILWRGPASEAVDLWRAWAKATGAIRVELPSA